MPKAKKPPHPDTEGLEEYTSALRSLVDLLRKLLASKVGPEVERWATTKAEKATTDTDRAVALDALRVWQTAVADLDELLRHMPYYLVVMVDLAFCEREPSMPEMPEALENLLKVYRRLHVSTLVEKTREASRGTAKS